MADFTRCYTREWTQVVVYHAPNLTEILTWVNDPNKLGGFSYWGIDGCFMYMFFFERQDTAFEFKIRWG